MANHNPSVPQVEQRPERPTVGITTSVPMDRISEIADRIGEVIGWVLEHGGELAGPPYLRYHTIDMDRELRIEAGVPVGAALAGEGDVQPGTLPAGRYAVTINHGAPDTLVAATGALLAWAESEGLRWDSHDTEAGEAWAGRIESYLSDPREVPDPSDWDTELAFKLAD